MRAAIMKKLKSPLVFRSNIFPVDEPHIHTDRKFIQSLRDPRSIKAFRNRFRSAPFSDLQKRIERRGIDLDCAYAEPGYHPWGTKVIDGEEKLVCLCENYSCHYFKECRPDFDISAMEGDVSEGVASHDAVFEGGHSEDAAFEDVSSDASGSSRACDLDARVREHGSRSSTCEVIEEKPVAPSCAIHSGRAATALKQAAMAPVRVEFVPASSVEKPFSAKREKTDETVSASSGVPMGVQSQLEFDVPVDALQPELPLVKACESKEPSVRHKSQLGESEEPVPAVAPTSADPDCGLSPSDSTCIEATAKDAPAVEPGPAPSSGGKGNRNLDVRQREVVCAHADARLYVNAAPGAGKTYSLIERVKFLIAEWGVAPDQILVLSFTRAAVGVVKERLQAAASRGELGPGWQSVDVATFDSFATRMLYWVEENDRDLLGRGFHVRGNDYDERIKHAITALKCSPELVSQCAHVLVDETQDLVGPRADMTLQLIRGLPKECGVTLFGDRCQALYDYQVAKDPSLTSSEEFYSEVMASGGFEQILLEKNHRQKKKMPYSLKEMRNDLLSCSAEDAFQQVDQIMQKLGLNERSLREMTGDEVRDAASSGTLGILTRTNSQALHVSAELSKKGVEHIVRRRDRAASLTRLIADVLCGYEFETIDRPSFLAVAEGLQDVSVDESEAAWMELVGLTGVMPEGSHYRVENLLSALYNNVAGVGLCAKSPSSPIVVSTIHGAKGAEFDTVWLLAEDEVQDERDRTLEEAKIQYVALSRPIKELRRIAETDSLLAGKRSPLSHRRDSASNRCFMLREGRGGIRVRRGAKKLTHFELLPDLDLDFKTMGESLDRQVYIRTVLRGGEPIRLLKREDDVTGSDFTPPRYRILLGGDERRELGETTRSFSSGYAECIKATGKELVSGYPDAFEELFVDRVVSCVSKSREAPKHAKAFGKYAIWHGFIIEGYARKDDMQEH